MKKIILYTVVFLVVNIVFLMSAALYMSHIVEKQDFKNWQTESNLLIIKNDAHYNLLFMGISHARNLSRHYNHLRVEDILQKKICNIAQGWDDDGVHVQYLYLKYFYDCGNTADTLVFFASPVMFYSDYIDKNPLSYMNEPFKLNFFWLNVTNGCENRWEQMLYYVRYKFYASWLDMAPNTTDTIENDFLTEPNTAVIAAGLKDAYRDGMNDTIFRNKCADMKKVVELAQTHHSKVIFVLPPAVFGKWPGTDKVVDFLKQLQPIYHTTCYDFSGSVKDPSMYYDHHHLNTKGVVYFTQNYLKLVLGK